MDEFYICARPMKRQKTAENRRMGLEQLLTRYLPGRVIPTVVDFTGPIQPEPPPLRPPRLPMTCHHVMMGHLLQRLPRPLAELVGAYRPYSIEEEYRHLMQADGTAALRHDCGEAGEFYCALTDVWFSWAVDGRTAYVCLNSSIGTIETHMVHLPEGFEPDSLQLVRFAIADRTPLQLLADSMDRSQKGVIYDECLARQILSRSSLCLSSAIGK